MAPKTKNALFSLGLTALVAGCGPSSNISKEADHEITNATMGSMLDSKPDSPIHTITMQPRFSRTVWLAEVNKMKNVYGAHISDEQVLKIKDYLVSINGEPDAAHDPSVAKYGE